MSDLAVAVDRLVAGKQRSNCKGTAAETHLSLFHRDTTQKYT